MGVVASSCGISPLPLVVPLVPLGSVGVWGGSIERVPFMARETTLYALGGVDTALRTGHSIKVYNAFYARQPVSENKKRK